MGQQINNNFILKPWFLITQKYLIARYLIIKSIVKIRWHVVSLLGEAIARVFGVLLYFLQTLCV